MGNNSFMGNPCYPNMGNTCNSNMGNTNSNMGNNTFINNYPSALLNSTPCSNRAGAAWLPRQNSEPQSQSHNATTPHTPLTPRRCVVQAAAAPKVPTTLPELMELFRPMQVASKDVLIEKQIMEGPFGRIYVGTLTVSAERESAIRRLMKPGRTLVENSSSATSSPENDSANSQLPRTLRVLIKSVSGVLWFQSKKRRGNSIFYVSVLQNL